MDDKEWYEKTWKANLNELTGETYYTVSDEQDEKEDITMSKKFTEEQYQRIIKAWQSENIFIHQTEAVIDCIIDDLNLSVTLIGDEAFALANPLTREWAHEQFVEKEKRYVWHLKEQHKHTDRIRLFKDLSDNSVSNYWTEQDNEFSEQEELTESEIKAWGYNPEMFDKEEVD